MPDLNLLVLRCRDLEACRAFYEHLGLTFAPHVHGTGPRHYAAEAHDFTLELYPGPADENADQTGLGFTVPDLASVHAYLANAGLNPGAVKQNPWGLTFVLRDPDGRRIELQQSESPHPPPVSPA